MSTGHRNLIKGDHPEYRTSVKKILFINEIEFIYHCFKDLTNTLLTSDNTNVYIFSECDLQTVINLVCKSYNFIHLTCQQMMQQVNLSLNKIIQTN